MFLLCIVSQCSHVTLRTTRRCLVCVNEGNLDTSNREKILTVVFSSLFSSALLFVFFPVSSSLFVFVSVFFFSFFVLSAWSLAQEQNIIAVLSGAFRCHLSSIAMEKAKNAIVLHQQKGIDSGDLFPNENKHHLPNPLRRWVRQLITCLERFLQFFRLPCVFKVSRL